MGNKKTLKVFSTASVAGMIATAVLSSQAFAAVDAYSVKVGEDVYQYSKQELVKSFLQSKIGEDAPLYNDFNTRLEKAGGFFAFHDDKTGYVDFDSIKEKFLEAKTEDAEFKVDEFTESKDAKVVEVPTVKKAVVKDGKVEYTDEENGEQGEVSVKAVTPLNLKQVKIEFGSKITDEEVKDDIEDEGNYTVENSDEDEVQTKSDSKDIVDKVELDESGKFAIITFKDQFDGKNKYEDTDETDEAIQNQETYRIIIDEAITGKEIVKEVEFKDLEMPEIESIEATGIDSIKIKFSEPVRPDYFDDDKKVACLDDEAVVINDDDISVDRIELTNDNTEANVYIGSKLKDKKELKVKVKGIIEDYAGLGVVAKTSDIVVEKQEEKPVVVGYKNVKKGEVTLVFDRDIKFKNDDVKVLPAASFDGDGDVKDTTSVINHELKDYYHTNDSNYAYAVKIDGNELTMYFNEDKRGLSETVYAYINSGEIESLWEVENDKVVQKVERAEDNVKPEVKSVKQDDDVENKVIVKFSEELDKDEAERKSNYTIEDEDGKEWKISGSPEYDNDDREVTIKTTKDLDSGKYTLTVEDVEDKDGNAIKKVTKDFEIVDKDALQEKDLTVNLYNSGDNDQKIVVDFDDKMKTGDDKFAVNDIDKYSLVATKDIFDGKDSIDIDSLYNSKINAKDDNNKVELTIPYKEDKSESYRLEFVKENSDKTCEFKVYGKDVTKKETNEDYAKVNLKLVVGRVSDSEGNVNTLPFAKPIKGEQKVNIDIDNGDKMVRAISTEKIEVTFDDKISFKNDDVKIIAAKDEAARDLAIAKLKDSAKPGSDDAKVLEVSDWDKAPNEDGNTVVTMTLDDDQEIKNNDKAVYDDDDQEHILNYDGTYGKDSWKVYVVVDAFKDGKMQSENDYDATLQKDVKVEVEDDITPAIIDNDLRTEDGIVGTNDKDNNDQFVQYWQDGTDGTDVALVLTFEEAIDGATLSTKTFDLDDDFEDGEVKEVYVDRNNNRKVVVMLENVKDDTDPIKVGDGFEVTVNNSFADIEGNEVEKGTKYTVGSFDEIGKPAGSLDSDAKDLLKSTALAKINAYADTGVTAPTLDDYIKAEVTGVTTNNLTNINVAVSAKNAGEADTTEKVQAIVDAKIAELQAAADKAAALVKIDKYAESNENQAPTVEDYKTAGVTRVYKDNLAEVNAAVEAKNATEANTTARVQAIVDVINTPAAPEGILVDVAAGKITGTLTTQEYSLDDGAHWTDCTAGEITGITFVAGNKVVVRLKETTTKLASENAEVITIATAPEAPATVTGTFTTANASTLTNATTAMEYTVDDGVHWLPVTAGIAAGTETFDATGAVVKVRVAATTTTLAGTATAKLN